MPSATSWSWVKTTVVFAIRTALVFLAVTIGGVVAGAALYRGVDLPATSDPADFQAAMVVVNGIHAMMLALLASRLRVAPLRAAGILFALFFGVQGLLTSMETAYFTLNGSLDLELRDILRGLASSAITALFGAAAAALVFRAPGEKRSDTAAAARPPAWRFPAALALYPVVYWTAGLLIALPSDAVTDFYADSIERIDPATLLALQVARGAVWAVLAMVAANGMQGSRWVKGGIVGTAFAVFMVAQLLYPNAAMPVDVRWIHFVEILVSNLLYGFAAVVLLDRPASGTDGRRAVPGPRDGSDQAARNL